MGNDKRRPNEEPDNAFVRFGPDRGKWLRKQVGNKGRNVPDVIRRVIDKEMVREELANEKPRKKP